MRISWVVAPHRKLGRTVCLIAVLVSPALLAACELFEGSPYPNTPPPNDASFDVPPPPGDVIPVTGDSSCGYEADTDAGPMYLTPEEAGKQNPCPPKPKPVAVPTGGGIPMDTTPGAPSG